MSEYVYVDESTNINGAHHFAASENSPIVIGKYCAIANGCKIITLNHDYNYPAVQGTFYKRYFSMRHPGETRNPPTKERTKGGVYIGNDVWIGEDVFISSGVTIGDGCCVGAKSVVTKDLAPYSICAGIPCLVKKKRYSDEMCRFLAELKWWNWGEKRIKKNVVFFNTNLNDVSVETLKTKIV